jgi:hypothetical protein
MNFHTSRNFSLIKGYLEHFLASFASNNSNDVKDFILQKTIEVLNSYYAINDLYEMDIEVMFFPSLHGAW